MEFARTHTSNRMNTEINPRKSLYADTLFMTRESFLLQKDGGIVKEVVDVFAGAVGPEDSVWTVEILLVDKKPSKSF